MKTTRILALILISFGYLINNNVHSQITYQSTLTPAQLVQDVLIGNGINAFNITYNGSAINANAVQIPAKSFTATNFPFPGGVYLRTQNAPIIVDADLSAIASGNITNGTILEFDFIATGDTLNFEYIFASAEYSGFTCSSFNDAFGFFLSGPGIAGPFTNGAVNVALVPGTNVPVTINTVNSGVASNGNPGPCLAADSNFTANSVYFTTSNGTFSGEGYTGSTVNMLAVSSLQCGGTYHIKLAICNVSDQALNSGVYLKAESFVSNVVTIEAQSTINSGSFTDTILAEGCVSTQLLFIRPEIYADSAQTFNVTLTGTATAADFVSLPTSVFFPPGVDTVAYTITPIADGITEPMEWVQIKGYSVTVCGDTIYDSLTLYVVDHYDYSYSVPDSVFAVCVPDTPQVAVTNIQGSIGPFQTQWSWGDTINPAFMPNNGFQPDTILYTITVLDGCGWAIVDTVILVVDSLPPAFNVTPGYLATYNCINADQLFTAAVTSPTIGPYTFTWSNGTVGTTSTLLDNNVSGDTINYTVSLLDGCGTTITDTVTIIANYNVPNFSIIPSQTLYANCPTQNVVAAISLTNATFPQYTISWSPGPTPSNGATVQIGNNGINGAQQWHYVTVTNGCGMSKSDSVLVINNFTLPTSQINPSPNLTVDCMVDTTQATGVITNGTNGPYTYLWSTGATTATINIPVDTTNGTVIPFSVTITDGCGFSTTSSGTVTVQQTLAVDTLIATLSSACLPTGTAIGTILGETTTTTPTYQWVGPSPSFIDTTNTALASNISPGMYTFTAWDDVCSVTDSVLVLAENPPVASFTANVTDGCAGMSVTFTNTSQNSSSYEWDFDNGNLATDNALTSHTEQYLTSGTVILTAWDATNTCSNTATLNINVVVCGCTDPNAINYDPNAVVQTGECIYPFPIVEDPNVFTPNGDGLNDLFFFKTSYTIEFHLTITNRWGNVMYDKIIDLTTAVGPQGWDGRAQSGKEADNGTYFYQYIATGINGDEVTGKGFLQLVRD